MCEYMYTGGEESVGRKKVIKCDGTPSFFLILRIRTTVLRGLCSPFPSLSLSHSVAVYHWLGPITCVLSMQHFYVYINPFLCKVMVPNSLVKM